MQLEIIKENLITALINPVKSMRVKYLPLLMVYFSYGALGLTSVAERFWIKESLSFTPADMASIGVWLTLPWTIKMVFGQLVDCVTIFGSQRKIYIFIGAGLVACGLILLSGAASGWLAFIAVETAFLVAKIIITIGTVLQDVVADAISTEVVARTDENGNPRDKMAINTDLGMVQILGRLALSFGVFSVAGVAGWLAQSISYDKIFLIALIIPVISVTGALLVNVETVEKQPIDWRIMGDGLVFGLMVLLLGSLEVTYAQELIFIVSIVTIVTLLKLLTESLDQKIRQQIMVAAIIIFIFRAMPSVGEGQQWWMIDILGFDQAFFGTLGQISAGLSMLAMWMFSSAITHKKVTFVLFWITVITAVLALPILGLYFGLHEWTQAQFGFGARTIALVDTALESPFSQLSMIPMLTLIAIYAPAGKRATWFALMASLMNLALVAGGLFTKYLNMTFVVERQQYDELGLLMIIVTAIGFSIPVAAIVLLGKKID